MENNLKIFESSEFGKVRTLNINGECWFVGKDVADILKYRNGSRDINRHVDEYDKQKMMLSDGRQNKETIIINESGLYSLVLSSKLPTAKKFKHWVTSEILPSVRKHGAYMTPETIEKVLNDPDFIIKLAQELKDSKAKVKSLESEITANKPKVLFADSVSASDTTILVRDFAKLMRQNGLAIGEKRLYAWLREQGLICKSSTYPTQRAMELNLFEVQEYTIHKNGCNPITGHTTKITGKGQLYLAPRLFESLNVKCV